MKERGILFSGPMVRAILDGSKTMTRRTVKPQPQERIWPSGRVDAAVIQEGGHWYACDHEDTSSHDTPYHLLKCPYGEPGDRLWVREKWHPDWSECTIRFSAGMTYSAPHLDHVEWFAADERKNRQRRVIQWRPSIHMPRWASRITLEVVSVRVERLQDISEKDAMAEGIPVFPLSQQTSQVDWSKPMAVNEFHYLWDSINAKKPGESWADDPFVWVIEFKRIGEGQK